MKTVKRFLALVIAGCGICFGASAEVITLQSSDSNETGSFNVGTKWSDGQVPSSDRDYLVDSGRQLRAASAASSVFHGHSLQIGTSESAGALLFRTPYWDTDVTFENDGLRLVKGTLGTWNTYGFTVNGPVSIEATTAFGIFGTGIGAWVRFTGAVTGAADTKLRVYSRTGDGRQDNFICAFAENSLAGYYGEIVCAHGTSDKSINGVRATFRTDGGAFPGSLVMMTNTTIEVAQPKTFTVSSLVIRPGGELYVKYDAAENLCACVEVLGSYSQEGKIVVRPTTFAANEFSAETPRKWPILKVPSGSALALSDFELDPLYPTFPSFHLVVDTLQDGFSELCLEQTNVAVYQKSADDGNGGKSFDLKNRWVDYSAEATFSADKDYLSKRQIRTQIDANAHVFGGHSLSFDKATFITQCASVTVDDLRIVGTNKTSIQSYATTSQTGEFSAGSRGCTEIFGGISIAPGAVLQFFPQRNYSYAVRSEISGYGDIEQAFQSVKSGTEWIIRGNLGLFGLNTNFFGRIRMTRLDNSPRWVDNARLYFNDARNLGGPLGRFTYDALHLGGYYTVICPLADVTLDTANRGIYFQEICGVDVTNDVFFTIAEKVHFNGKVTKFGTGTLSMGGPEPAFVASDGTINQSSSRSGYNELIVTNGGLHASSYKAMNGLKVTLFADARLVVDVQASETDMALGQYGIFNTKVDTPFVFPADGANIELRNPHGFSRSQLKSRKVPICTVSASAAAGVRGSFKAPTAPCAGLACEIGERENGDGTVTFQVSFMSSNGFEIIVR